MPDETKRVRIENQASLLDILPTLLHILDTDPPEQTIGKVLLEDKELLNWLKTMLSRRNDPRYNFSELDKQSSLKAILTPEWKYIYNYKNKTDQLYNIKLDPHELKNLADTKTKECTQLKGKLRSWVASSKKYPIKSQVFEISQEEKEKLEAMGYLDTQDMKVDR